MEFDPARGAECAKRRPAIVLTADELCKVRKTVVVVPVSSKPRSRPPIIVAVPSAGVNSVAVCDQMRAVDKIRLVSRQGRLAPADLRAVEDGIRAVLVL
jgi:mRNA interferase MazF